MKNLLLLCGLCLAWNCAFAQTQSLREHELHQLLVQVAQRSNAGAPRVINEDLLDLGYRAQGSELVNRIGVRPRHAAQMRDNPAAVRAQLAASVCANPGFRRLLARGAGLRYEFGEHPEGRPIAVERFRASDCGL